MEFIGTILSFALLFQLALSSPGVETEDELCPKFWQDGSSVGLGCLLFNSTTAYSWEDASTYCQKEENASLAVIMTMEQKEFVIMELYVVEDHDGARKDWWLGGTDAAREGQWTYPATCETVLE